jgi:integrase
VEKFKFTDTAIRKLPLVPRPSKGMKGPKDSFGFDIETSHFALRVTYESKVFYFHHRDKKGPFRKKLGNFPDISAKAARALVDGLNGDVARGVDLRALEEAKRAPEPLPASPGPGLYALTLGQLLESWATTITKDRRQSYVETTVADLKRAFGPARPPDYLPVVDLLALPIDPATNAEIEAQIEGRLEALDDRPAARRVAIQKLRSLCRWGVKRKKIGADPTATIDLGDKSQKRDVHLTGEEARLVWRVAGTLPSPYGQAIRYLMASGLRLREAIESRRSEFSPDFSEHLVGAERMKEGQAHIVFLPPALRQMLRELTPHQGSDLLFTRDGKTPVSGVSHLKGRLDRALAKSGAAIKPFRFHDLRRTITTCLVRSGVNAIVADRLLAHKGLGEIAATYNIYNYQEERKAALEKWIDFLTDGEAMGIPGPTPQRALPALDPIPLNGTVLPPVSTSLAILEAYEPSVAVTRYLPAQPEQRDEQTERVQRRIIKILADPRVMRANLEILKAPLTEEFKAKHSENPHAEAIKFLAHCAAMWAIDKRTVLKTSEVKAERDVWEEIIQAAKDGAREARLAAEQARKLKWPEYAEGHEADARRLEAEAEAAATLLRGTITLDDPRCVGYRPGDRSYPAARAKGLSLSLTKVAAGIFGRQRPTWAAAYAGAATGGVVTRHQARARRHKPRRVS